MSHANGYFSATVTTSGAGIKVNGIPVGVVVNNLTFVNYSASPATFSGTTNDTTQGSENFGVLVPATASHTVEHEFFCAGGMKFESVASNQVSFRYGQDRTPRSIG